MMPPIALDALPFEGMRRLIRQFGVVCGAALVLAGLTLPALGAFAGTFSDDDGSVHQPNIEAIAAAGITQGCDTSGVRFCPTDGVTRAQMASFLARALDLAGPAPDAFSDDTGSTHEEAINLVSAAGIALGCGDGLYCPTAIVSRAQMASFLVRAIDTFVPATADYFLDDTGNTHESAINVLRENGVTQGCNELGNFYCPTGDVTRAQMASFLARALGLDPIVPEPPSSNDPDFYTTPSVVGTGLRIVNVPTSGTPTLQQAFDDALPGDTIVLAAGTHTLGGQGNQVLERSGTANAWIEVRGADGARPVIDLQGSGELRLSGSHVALEHLEIRSGSGNNLHIAPSSADISNIVVRDVVISGLNSGPGAAIKINRNNTQAAGVSLVYIEDCDVSGAIGNAVIDGVGVDQAVVRDCWIHDNAVGSHGIFFKGGSSDILIERNLVSGIRLNAALQLGGNTGAEFWNPAHPDWEGVDQVARNNLIADVDDSAIEIRGVDGARVYHNTIVTQSTFAIFRLSEGNTASAGTSDNQDVEIVNNLVIATGGDPQYARNDGATESVVFLNQLWGGSFRNSGSPTPGIPQFPASGDVVVSDSGVPFVLVDPVSDALSGLAEALARYRPVSASAALGKGVAAPLVGEDILGVQRSESAPAIGAFEVP